jgi:hypothetical protein
MPGSVDTGNPSISEYATDASSLMFCAKPPSPDPSTSATFGSKSVFFRTHARAFDNDAYSDIFIPPKIRS